MIEIPNWTLSSAERRRAFAEGLAAGRKQEREAVADWLIEMFDLGGVDGLISRSDGREDIMRMIEAGVPEE